MWGLQVQVHFVFLPYYFACFVSFPGACWRLKQLGLRAVGLGDANVAEASARTVGASSSIIGASMIRIGFWGLLIL